MRPKRPEDVLRAAHRAAEKATLRDLCDAATAGQLKYLASLCPSIRTKSRLDNLLSLKRPNRPYPYRLRELAAAVEALGWNQIAAAAAAYRIADEIERDEADMRADDERPADMTDGASELPAA